MSGTTAVILAGGLGTRLRPVICDQPKVLAPVNGRPFLAYLLDQLANAGIEQAVLCTGYKGDQIVETFGQKYRGIELAYSREDTPLGTAGALRLALPLIQSEVILAMNGDSFCSVDMLAFLDWHHAVGLAASMVLRDVPDTARYGRVALTPGGQVRSFEEKREGLGGGWVNAGIYLTSRHLLAGIPPGRPVSLEREMLPDWIAGGVGAYQTQGQFLDIGLPDSYAQAERFFSREVRKAA